MLDLVADVAVLGSGFSGSLCALILARGGLRPVVIDRTAHPRFAIGESSTPIANYVLGDLARRYDFAWLLPLCKYGSWQQHYPQIVGGRKRGFSYFAHRPHEEFTPRGDHANELLVAASHSDEQSDTHWLRADVDALFARQLTESGIPLLEHTHVDRIEKRESPAREKWELTGFQGTEPVRVRCQFLIDGTGEAGALAKAFQIPVSAAPLVTRSRAVFGHFRQLGSWHDWLSERQANVQDHPFCCDDAAQHQLVDGAWMWILRFNNGVTSAGFAIDAERSPPPSQLPPEDEFCEWLARYPSLISLFLDASLVDPPGRIVRTGLLPRRAAQAVGDGWAMLPHTAGFIDPLHSSGIAHSLCGVERLTNALLRSWNRVELTSQLQDYQRAVFGELQLIDRLVHGCYRSLTDFRLFTPYSMLYFAAATWYERQRAVARGSFDRWFLCADDPRLCSVVHEMHDRVVSLTAGESPASDSIEQFARDLAESLVPYNIAGLCDPSVRNMYRYTAAE